MSNAPLDPLSRPKLTSRELAKAFKIIRGDELKEFSAFPCFDDLVGVDEQVFFSEDDLPEAVIFISHRWRSPTHPDPDGRQLSAVKTFLSFASELCLHGEVDRTSSGGGLLSRFRRALERNSRRTNPSLQRILFTHGGYQAAYFLGSYNRFDPNSVDTTRLLDFGDDVLARVGVWYDYSCMSQGAATRANLVGTLERLHELLNATNFVALRQPEDEYDSRAWCAAEAATDPDNERTRFRKICLRLDKIGESFPPAILLQQPAHFEGIPAFTLAQLESAMTGAEAARAINLFIQMVGVDAEDERDFPLFFVKRRPWIFEGQKAFMEIVMKRLARASVLDETTASNRKRFSVGLDLAKVVSDAAKSVGLGASKAEDIPYTALMILYARHRGAPELARLFADCLVRHLHARTTVVMRYRENREQYNNVRCWYRFQDDVAEGTAPDWS